MTRSSLLTMLSFTFALGACGGSSGGESTGSTSQDITGSNYPQAAYVTYLYEVGLGREPDKPGLDANVQFLVVNGCTSKTLGQVARGILTSAEFKANPYPPEEKIEIAYWALLNRSADEKAYAYWLNQLVNGPGTWAQLVDGLLASKEFAAWTPSRCTP